MALSNQYMDSKTGVQALWRARLSRSGLRPQPAFSLIELLAVIAVIAVLLSLLLPALLRAQSRARQAGCIHNMHQLGLGLNQFMADYHVYPMSINADFRKGGYPEHYSDWIDALEYEGLSASKNNRFYESGVWHCPSASRPRGFPAEGQYGSYAYNSYGVGLPQNGDPLGLGGHSVKAGAGISPPPVTEMEVVQPSGMMAIGESFGGGMEFLRENLQALNRWDASSRHQGKAIVLFCDGHVEPLSVKAVFADIDDVALSRWNRDNQPHRERLTP